jgi:hypothetical protein
METMMRETTVTRKWIPSALWIDSGELPSFEARDYARCYSRPYDRSEDGPTDGCSIKYVRADNFDALVAALEQAQQTINELTWNKKITGKTRERLSRVAEHAGKVLSKARE